MFRKCINMWNLIVVLRNVSEEGSFEAQVVIDVDLWPFFLWFKFFVNLSHFPWFSMLGFRLRLALECRLVLRVPSSFAANRMLCDWRCDNWWVSTDALLPGSQAHKPWKCRHSSKIWAYRNMTSSFVCRLVALPVCVDILALSLEIKVNWSTAIKQVSHTCIALPVLMTSSKESIIQVENVIQLAITTMWCHLSMGGSSNSHWVINRNTLWMGHQSIYTIHT